MHHYRASLLRVLDGDTIEVLLDLGFYITLRQHLRLVGIDTPELNSPDPTARALAQQARARLEALLPPVFLVRTLKPSGSVDKYGRFLAEVELLDGRTASEVLLAEGLARPYPG